MNRKLMIALVALVAVLVVGVGLLAAYIFVIQPGQGGGAQVPARTSQRTTAAGFYPMTKFVTNLADTSRTRYIEVSLSLGTTKAGAETELEKLDPQMRDAVLSQLRSMTAQELSGAEGKDRLAEAIEEGLREIPEVDQLLVKVYVTDMVIQ
jgi:flagellar FliL protein